MRPDPEHQRRISMLRSDDEQLLQRARDEVIVDANQFLTHCRPPFTYTTAEEGIQKARRLIETLLVMVAKETR